MKGSSWRRALAVAFAVGGLSLIGVVVADSSRLLTGSFPGFLAWNNGVLVAFHLGSWSGARSEVPLNGGRILAVNDAPFAGGAALMAEVAPLPIGTLVRYRIEWEGRDLEYVVPTMELSLGDYLSTFGVYLLNGVCFLLIAVISLYLRPDLPVARALAYASLCMGGLLTLVLDYFTTYRFVWICQLLEAWTPAALAQFALIFPTPRLSARGRRAVNVTFGGICLSLGIGNITLFYSDPVVSRQVVWLIYSLIALIGIGLVASFGEALLRAQTVQARVRSAVVFAGGLVALFLPAILILAFFLLGWVLSYSWITLLLPIFPLSILYAVVRHDLLHVERFVRLTVGYTMATAAVVAGYAATLLTINAVIERGAETTPTTSFVVLLAIAIGFDPLRRRLQRIVDRLFFRSEIDGAEVLETASSELAALSGEEAIIDYVEETLRGALNVVDARLSLGQERSREVAIQAPVVVRGEVLGHLACGGKRSGAPFSSLERDLVNGLASQAALALRNARSIQALRDAQAQLVRSERLAAIGELAGAVAHGIRNPLSSIRVTAQLALEQNPDGADREPLSAVIREADRLDQRVRTLLDFSRPFEPCLRPVDLREVINSVRDAVLRRAVREGVNIRLIMPEEPAICEVDRDYLEEALLELVANALRVLTGGGELRLEIHSSVRGPVLRVVDDGPGIPKGVQERIFELFFTTRSDGTGMGLATVKKLIEIHGGSVVLESSGSEGTIFRVELEGPRRAGAEP